MTTLESRRRTRRGAKPQIATELAEWYTQAREARHRNGDATTTVEHWAAFQAHLHTRRPRREGTRLFARDDRPLFWAVPTDILETCERINRLVKSSPRKSTATERCEAELRAWLAESTQPGEDIGYAIAALVWCYALPHVAQLVPFELWTDLHSHLVATAADAALASRDPLVSQLLAAELPLALAYVLPELPSCAALVTQAQAALAAGFNDLVDAEGLPHSRHLAHLRLLLACWTRCNRLTTLLQLDSWAPSAAETYTNLVANVLRLTRRDGTQALSPSSAKVKLQPLIEAALRTVNDRDLRRAADQVLSIPSSKAGKRRFPRTRLPGVHAEPSTLAVLRSDWSAGADRLSVAFHDDPLTIEFASRRAVYWTGSWRTDIQVSGEPLQADDEWQSVCWVSDEDVTYLELQLNLTGDAVLQRQMLLCHRERLLLLAHAVTTPDPGPIVLQTSLPLSEGIDFVPTAETREGRLVGAKRQPLVVPLALPEWKSQSSTGHLSQTALGLTLSQTGQGGGLYAPLLFELSGRSALAQRCTWRQLTVAESRTMLPHCIAVGYRLQLHRRQWLLYRSLTPTANRTLLGQNLISEFLFAEFLPNGTIQNLLEVE